MKKLFKYYFGLIPLTFFICFPSLLFSQDSTRIRYHRTLGITNIRDIISVSDLSRTFEITELPGTPDFYLNNQVDCDCLSDLGGKEFDRISYVLSGTSGTLYFNDYFNGHPSLSSFQRSFIRIPNTSAPDQTEQAGEALRAYNIPSTFSNLVFELNKIRCSSKYGGSIEYTFKSVESVGYEFTTPNYLFDFSKFNIRVYVTAVARTMNAVANQIPSFSSYFVEFDYDVLSAYDRTNQYDAGGKRYRDVTIVDESQFESSLQELETSISSYKTSLQPGFMSLTNFNYGVIRAINSPLFQQSNTIVDQVRILDNEVTLKTRAGVKVASVSMRIRGINVNTEGGEEEFNITIYEGTGYGFNWRKIVSFEELDQNESTRWFGLGSFEVHPNCNSKTFNMHYGLVERDDGPLGLSTVFTVPDRFDVRPHSITIQCNSLNGASTNNIVEQGIVSGIEVHTENMVYDLKGTISFEYKVVVYLR